MAYILKTEIVMENGVELKKTYYTSDGKTIIGVSTEDVPKEEPEETEKTEDTEEISEQQSEI